MSEPGPASSFFRGDDTANTLIVIICSALAGYNALELLLLIFTTFSRYRGLYFWSLLVATSAIIPYAIGLCIFYFAWTSKLAGYIINNVGWIALVSGQSAVLYSRLGVVLGKGHETLLRFVKWMIIISSIVFYIPITVVVFGSHYAPNQDPYTTGYKYCEKIQMTGFCLQEFIISGIYLWKTIDIIQEGQKRQTKRVMWQLLIINVIIIVLDIGLLVLEYRNLFIAEVAFKELAYSIKLKLEFAILSKLVEWANHAPAGMLFAGHRSRLSDNISRVESAATNAAILIPSSPILTSSRGRSQWPDAGDALKVDSDKLHREEASRSSDARLNDHNFDSDQGAETLASPPSVDLMYAQAMRGITK